MSTAVRLYAVIRVKPGDGEAVEDLFEGSTVAETLARHMAMTTGYTYMVKPVIILLGQDGHENQYGTGAPGVVHPDQPGGY